MGRLFVEADGVLMDRADINKPEELIHDDYYSLRLPEWNVLHALKSVIKKNPHLEVYVICHVPLSIEKAKAHLAEWFGCYLPEAAGLRFLPLKEYFGSYIALMRGDILLSADLGNLALFAYGGCYPVGTDIDTGAIPGILSIRTRDCPDATENLLLSVIGEGR